MEPNFQKFNLFFFDRKKALESDFAMIRGEEKTKIEELLDIKEYISENGVDQLTDVHFLLLAGNSYLNNLEIVPLAEIKKQFPDLIIVAKSTNIQYIPQLMQIPSIDYVHFEDDDCGDVWIARLELAQLKKEGKAINQFCNNKGFYSAEQGIIEMTDTRCFEELSVVSQRYSKIPKQ